MSSVKQSLIKILRISVDYLTATSWHLFNNLHCNCTNTCIQLQLKFLLHTSNNNNYGLTNQTGLVADAKQDKFFGLH